MALEPSSGTWRLAFTVGLGQKPRLKTVGVRSTFSLLWQIKAAKKRFGLPEDAPVISCYEGFVKGARNHFLLVCLQSVPDTFDFPPDTFDFPFRAWDERSERMTVA